MVLSFICIITAGFAFYCIRKSFFFWQILFLFFFPLNLLNLFGWFAEKALPLGIESNISVLNRSNSALDSQSCGPGMAVIPVLIEIKMMINDMNDKKTIL